MDSQSKPLLYSFSTEVQGDTRTVPLFFSTHPGRKTHKGQPQHRELHALLFSNSVWVLLRPTVIIYEHGRYLWDGAYGLSSLSEKTWKSNHLLFTQHFLLSYFKTLSVGPAGVELTTSRMTGRCSTNEPPVRDCWLLARETFVTYL